MNHFHNLYVFDLQILTSVSIVCIIAMDRKDATIRLALSSVFGFRAAVPDIRSTRRPEFAMVINTLG